MERAVELGCLWTTHLHLKQCQVRARGLGSLSDATTSCRRTHHPFLPLKGDAESRKPHATPSALIVTQPYTPELSPLPRTVFEGFRLQRILDASKIASIALIHRDATVDAVRSAMKQNSWVHFAWHGSQDAEDVTRSAFALYDGPLTLTDLMSTTSDNADLAFLSECQTTVGDEKIPEESAHLAAGMLAVGFKGVVERNFMCWVPFVHFGRERPLL